MKRLVASISLLIYVSAAAFTALNLHYCEGKWMTTPDLIYSHSSPATCHSCNSAPEKDCCKHPKIKLSLSPDQLIFSIDQIHVYLPHQACILPTATLSDEKENFLIATGFISPPSRAIRIDDRLAYLGSFLI
ncbi:MAG: hypothetical protein K6T34_07880 [Thermoflavifilum sp.]|nr:hypothetical protein [Thermoflavifilum sp.]